MEEKHPEAIDLLRGFAEAHQVELLSGGFYEPILSVLPDADRIMQLEALTEHIRRLFGRRPQGMWLAERVWEPQMPRSLSAAGMEYFPVDDYHFKLTGLDDRDLTGYFITEENGCSIEVFPGSERLRYYIPFRGIDELLSYFREVHAGGGSPLLTLADDGEKFGVWPKTNKHCYEDGWLERFFSALEENAQWIETTTFSGYRSAFRPRGIVYLPTASYREMGEWVLPPEKGHEYEHALSELEKIFGERAKGMVRGGIWRSFFSKYPEANHLHKRMMIVSRKVHEAAEKCKVQKEKFKGKTQKTMLHELWMGQCNDAYWHGIFGGLYLPHLRSSLYRHLITAESMAEKVLSASGSHRVTGKAMKKDSVPWKAEGDLDCDGFKDMLVSTPTMAAFFSERGGSLVELSLKRTSINVLDTLSRRREAYHSRLAEAVTDSAEAKTIHEQLIVKEQGLSDYLVYDAHTRASLLDHFFHSDIRLDSLMKSAYEEAGDFVDGSYGMRAYKTGTSVQVKLSREGTVSGHGVTIRKEVRFNHSRMRVEYLLEGGCSGIFGIELNISLLGSPYASLNVKNKTLLIKDRGTHDGVTGFSVRDGHLDLGLDVSFDEETTLWHYPVETVSLSEEGVERIYQGTAFLFMNRLDFHGRKRLGFNMDFREAK
jgi:alpha-amylase